MKIHIILILTVNYSYKILFVSGEMDWIMEI